MIHKYIEQISNRIKSDNPEFTKSVFIARIDDDGRILQQIEPTKNEFKWAGISDNDSNYFYIRHRDSGEINYEQSSNGQRISCSMKRFNARFEFRIVASMKNVDPYCLENSLIQSIMKTNHFDYGNEKVLSTNIIRSQIDSISVLKNESPKPKQFDKSMMFVAIDFDLIIEFIYT